MAGVHEDFGEKIGGAKKDLWKDRGLYADDLEAMNEREAEKFVKKDNVWKKPDYAAMLEEGIPLGVVYFIKKARDGLNASPQYYRTDDTPEKRTARQKEYIKTVRELQTVLSDVRTVEDAMRAYDRFFVDNGYLEKVQGWVSGIHYRATKKGQDNPVITNKLSNTMLIRSAEYFERNFTQKAKKEQFCVSKEQKIPKGYAIHFNDGKHTYSKNEDWKPGTYYVTKGYSILRTNFETKEAALKWVQELAKGRNKNGKIRFVPPQLAHVKRTGPDYRNGVEITGQHYLDTFGFRGGEFGNWMNQNDRQTSLNMGFEALKDLASALKISDKDIAYQGTLPIHVRCLIDEAANIGQIPNLERLMATIRSREISACLVLQAQSQLKALYKDNMDTIIGNCDASLFLGGKEETTLKSWNSLLGKETIDLYNTSVTKGNQESHGQNFQKLGKDLMSVDELAVMDGGKCLLQIRGVRPFLSRKYDITKHPNYKLLSDFNEKNAFNIEKFLSTRMPMRPGERYRNYEVTAEDLASQTL